MTHVYFNAWYNNVVSIQGSERWKIDLIGLIVQNKHINGLEINLQWVIITFNNGFSVFNVCCGPRSILMSLASCRALISTRATTNVKHLKTPLESYSIIMHLVILQMCSHPAGPYLKFFGSLPEAFSSSIHCVGKQEKNLQAAFIVCLWYVFFSYGQAPICLTHRSDLATSVVSGKKSRTSVVFTNVT